MPVPFVPPVEVRAVSRQQTTHEGADIAPRRLQQQVDVVGHQAKKEQANAEPFHPLFERVQEPFAVAVIPENRPPLISPKRDVIIGILKLYSGLSSPGAGKRSQGPSYDLIRVSPFCMQKNGDRRRNHEATTKESQRGV